MFKPLALIATLFCTATLTLAQSLAPTTFPKEFPADAQTPDAKALPPRLGDRVFKATGPNGLGWRLDINGGWTSRTLASSSWTSAMACATTAPGAPKTASCA